MKSENEAVSLLNQNESVLTVLRSQFKRVADDDDEEGDDDNDDS